MSQVALPVIALTIAACLACSSTSINSSSSASSNSSSSASLTKKVPSSNNANAATNTANTPTGTPATNPDPLLADPVEPPSLANPSETYTYQVRDLPLYGPTGLPALDDVAQGEIGDCYFQAGLVSIIGRSPSFLSDQIKRIGHTADGTDVYSINMFYPDPSDPVVPPTKLLSEAVVISAKLLTDSQGHTISNDGKPLWSSLYEKAFAVLSDDRALFTPDRQGHGYEDITEGGNTEGIQAISGLTLTGTAFLGYGDYPNKNAMANPDLMQILNMQASGQSVLLTTLLQSYQANLQALATKNNLPFNGTQLTLPSGNTLVIDAAGYYQIKYSNGQTCTVYASHTYSLLGLNPSDASEVLIRNPWDVSDPTEICGGLFTMALVDFKVLVGEIAVLDIKK